MRETVSLVVVLFSFVTLLSQPATARTWLIKDDMGGDAPTIQAGVDSAVSFQDTVLLAAGTFTGPGNRDVDFKGKAIVVTSQSGPASTIINCQDLGRGFVFQTGEGSPSKLIGVTIENGLAGTAGGGILCAGTAPTITGNVIRNCDANAGGGIACTNQNAKPAILLNEISGNTATTQGGGIYLFFSEPSVSNNKISGNQAQDGGGIYSEGLFATNPNIGDNTISGNTAAQDGGGMKMVGLSPGGVGFNIISENNAAAGGGVLIEDVSGVLFQNTIAENSATSGSGIYFRNTAITVQQTIVAFNNGGSGLFCDAFSSPVINCCVVSGNTGGDAICGTDTDNTNEDPEFCGILGSGNFFLQSDSPAATSNSLCNAPIGALGIDCGTSSTRQSTWGLIKSIYR